jgi:hypothetical protein
MTLRTTLLDAVNQLLSAVGGSAVVSLDTDNPEVATAVAILEETTQVVLSEGWNFNTEKEYPFQPNQLNEILVGDNILTITTSRPKHYADYQIVERQGKLYDKLAHSYKFNETIYCDVVWGFEFADCPQPFKNYITAKASRIYASRLVGSKEQVELVSQDEAICRAACLEYDSSTSQVNMFSHQNGQDTYISYIPLHTLAR